MFSYYGSKSKLVDLYPSPHHGRIIEPFAGSARYALKWFDRDVLLVDKYSVVVDVWHYLQSASVKDITGLPKLTAGTDIRTLGLSKQETMFVGFMCGVARGKPAFKVSPFAAAHFCEEGRESPYAKVAKQLYKIRHWRIVCGEYTSIENQQATWFIDPPYQVAGRKQYAHTSSSIDYKHLAAWSQSRIGQVIVCENMGADWLPFEELATLEGHSFRTIEAIWTNYQLPRQASLFETPNTACSRTRVARKNAGKNQLARVG